MYVDQFDENESQPESTQNEGTGNETAEPNDQIQEQEQQDIKLLHFKPKHQQQAEIKAAAQKLQNPEIDQPKKQIQLTE